MNVKITCESYGHRNCSFTLNGTKWHLKFRVQRTRKHQNHGSILIDILGNAWCCCVHGVTG